MVATKQVTIFILKNLFQYNFFVLCFSSTATVAMIDKTSIAFISCVVIRSLCLL